MEMFPQLEKCRRGRTHPTFKHTHARTQVHSCEVTQLHLWPLPVTGGVGPPLHAERYTEKKTCTLLQTLNYEAFSDGEEDLCHRFRSSEVSIKKRQDASDYQFKLLLLLLEWRLL